MNNYRTPRRVPPRTPSRRPPNKPATTAHTTFAERLTTQALVCGIILAAVLLLRLSGGEGATGLRAQLSATLSGEVTFGQVAGEIQRLLNLTDDELGIPAFVDAPDTPHFIVDETLFLPPEAPTNTYLYDEYFFAEPAFEDSHSPEASYYQDPSLPAELLSHEPLATPPP